MSQSGRGCETHLLIAWSALAMSKTQTIKNNEVKSSGYYDRFMVMIEVTITCFLTPYNNKG